MSSNKTHHREKNSHPVFPVISCHDRAYGAAYFSNDLSFGTLQCYGIGPS